ncbi:MAG: DUF3365 domain-containing protein [Planctomycetales bacterium]|nr:DUF3365 domain-containing protein [Planctomycetales bacterium]
MLRSHVSWAYVFIGLFVLGCSQPSTKETLSLPSAANQSSEDELDSQAKQKAMRVCDELAAELVKRLGEAMADGGPANAIEVCSQQATQIAKLASEKNGVHVGRTSFKLRNPQNAAPSWAQELVERREAQPQVVRLGNNSRGVLLPIMLKPQCLACHGASESLAPEISDKLAALYPEDQAKGFADGDLRGWFWVEIPAL